MNDKKVRVRFAPSPTGQLHLGGARTALFNWLFSKKHGGKFLLRIENTDKLRSKQEFTDQICDSIKWLGLDWDEEIVFQSSRTILYKNAIEKLLETEKAYRCFCSKEKIAEERSQAEKAGGGYYYSGTCHNLNKKEIQNNIENKIPFSVRIAVPEGHTEFEDKIYGNIRVNNKEIDDFIIARTDGSPVYNLVVAIDDNDMSITHIIRGEDHISNTPKQLIIYKALNLAIPKFAHLPMILGPDKKRLSKRHGATGVQEYRDKGILPEALTNYLALLGWNPGTEQELFISETSDIELAELEKLTNEFSIDRIQKKSAVFDERKLEWMNKQYIKNTPAPKLYFDIKSLHNDWILSKSDNNYLFKVINLMKERVTTIHDFVTKTDYFFTDPTEYEEKAIRKRWKDDSVNKLIDKYTQKLSAVDEWSIDNIERSLRDLAEKVNVSPGKIIHPTRLVLSGSGSGPSLFDMMELLGKETCLRRLQKAIDILPC